MWDSGEDDNNFLQLFKNRMCVFGPQAKLQKKLLQGKFIFSFQIVLCGVFSFFKKQGRNGVSRGGKWSSATWWSNSKTLQETKAQQVYPRYTTKVPRCGSRSSRQDTETCLFSTPIVFLVFSPFCPLKNQNGKPATREVTQSFFFV